jgi:hypothetical protein
MQLLKIETIAHGCVGMAHNLVTRAQKTIQVQLCYNYVLQSATMQLQFINTMI